MRKGKVMRRNFIIAIVLMFIVMGYALLSANLDITGNYSIKSMKWDIHFDNPVLSNGSVSGTPTITDNDTTVSYTFTFSEPTDFYEFSVDVVNDGTMDGIISEIDNDVYDSTGNNKIEIPDYLEYSIINTTNNKKIEIGQTLAKKTTETYKVRINMKSGLSISELPQYASSMRFKLNIDFSQKKKESEENYNYYDNKAKLSEAYPALWNYEITDSENHIASITGFNEYYNGSDYESTKNFVYYCHNNSSSYCDLEYSDPIPELSRIVFPYKVKLNSSGDYSEKGEEYTITSVDISNGDDYYLNNGIQKLIFPNTVTSITLIDDYYYGYKYLDEVKLPNNLESLPYFGFVYSYGEETPFVMPTEIRIPRSITSLDDVDGNTNFKLDDTYYYNYENYTTFGDFDSATILYIPKEVTSISSDSIYFPNFKKFYVETKSVKSKLITAIEGYCDDNYSYYSDTYSDSSECVRKISSKIVYDPMKF